MLETPFPFFIHKKQGEIPIFGIFLAKKWIFFFSILVYFHWKSTFWVRPCLKTSLWCHTLTDFHDFGINGKRRPYPIPWYQTIILWARQFQVHKGGGNPGGTQIWKWRTRAYRRMKIRGIHCEISSKKGVIRCGHQKKWGLFWCGLPEMGVIQCAKVQFQGKICKFSVKIATKLLNF